MLPARSSVPPSIFAERPRQSQSAVRRALSKRTPAHANAASDGICAAKSPENRAILVASGALGDQLAAFVASSSTAPVQFTIPDAPVSGSASGPASTLAVSCASERIPFHTRNSSYVAFASWSPVYWECPMKQLGDVMLPMVQLGTITEPACSIAPVVTSRRIQRISVAPSENALKVMETW